jgi:amino acid transporter
MMTTEYSSLFTWWEASIMWCTAFLVAASIYLYADSRRKKRAEKPPRTRSVIKNFAFVWVLLALLGLYIITITSTSQPIFIAGNLVVEVLLLFYIILRGRTTRSTAKQPQTM